jgi:hypothetical protein
MRQPGNDVLRRLARGLAAPGAAVVPLAAVSAAPVASLPAPRAERNPH